MAEDLLAGERRRAAPYAAWSEGVAVLTSAAGFVMSRSKWSLTRRAQRA